MIRIKKEFSVPDSCLSIIKKLQENGFIAYLAGGSVRDFLLNLKPKDFDIATNATPDEVEKLFPDSIPVGKRFGVMIVRSLPAKGANDESCANKTTDEVANKILHFEVATFRNDLNYKDGRRPEGVEFSTPIEDAQRRDFTVNGLFYDTSTSEIIDYVGGIEDIRNKVLRAIGEPNKRFQEDYLRMFRAIRFAVRFNLRIEPKAIEAIKANANNVENLSAERVKEELEKIFSGQKKDIALRLLDHFKLLDFWIPEISACHGILQDEKYHPEGDVFEHICKILKVLNKDADTNLCFGALFHDIGKPLAYEKSKGENFIMHDKYGEKITATILDRLKFSKNQKEEIIAMVKEHQHFHDAPKMRKSTLKRLLSQPFIEKLLEIHRADTIASTGDLTSYNFCIDALNKMTENKTLSPPPLITGEDLIKIGFFPGPIFKKIIDHITTLQLEEKIKTKEEAIYEITHSKWRNS